MSGGLASVRAELARRGRDLSLPELLDAAWIARRLGDPARPPAPPTAATPLPAATPDPRTGPAEPTGEPPESTPPRHPVESAGANATGDRPAVAVCLPAGGPPLRERGVVRALRGFRHRVPSRVRAEVDEDGTAELRAETRLPLVRLRPVAERGLSACLVVDASASMEVWADAVRAWVRAVNAAGVFRTVRLLRLYADGPVPTVGRWHGAARPGPALPVPSRPVPSRPPGGAGTVVLVVSDLCSRGWWDGSAFRLFAGWGRTVPVGLVGLLPDAFWPRTPVGRYRLVRLNRPAPAGPLRMAAAPGLPAGDVLPVGSLHPRSLAALAGLLGHNRTAAVGGGVWVPAEFPAAAPAAPADEPPAEEVVRRFVASASAEAVRLARLLALFDRPTVRTLQLVRAAARLDATAVQDAEVLLGGLLRAERAGRDGRAGWAYTFRPGVRAALRRQAAWGEPEPRRFLDSFHDYLKRRRDELNGIRAAVPAAGHSPLRGMEDVFLTLDTDTLAAIGPRTAGLQALLTEVKAAEEAHATEQVRTPPSHAHPPGTAPDARGFAADTAAPSSSDAHSTAPPAHPSGAEASGRPDLPRFHPGDRPLADSDWELVRLLRRDGIGEVWTARTPGADHPRAALKFFSGPPDRARERARREVEQATLLGRAPSGAEVVLLRRAHLSNDPPCLEYPLVDAPSLADRMTRPLSGYGALTVDEATEVILKVAGALAVMHSAQLVHRDLNPANILLTGSGPDLRVTLIDFGLAATTADDRPTFHVERLNGGPADRRPYHAAPELAGGGHTPAAPTEDVYALGVIWYQLLVGDAATAAPTGGRWKARLRDGGVSDRLVRVLASCLEHDPARRPANAARLAAAIRSALGREAEAGGPPPLTGYQPGDVVSGRIVKQVRDGLQIKVHGQVALLPANQVDVRRPKNLAGYIGRTIECLVQEVNTSGRPTVVSRRKLIELHRDGRRAELLDELDVGQVRKCVVKSIAPFGAFVDLGGVDGLLHITDMAWHRVADPREVVTDGQEIEVYVLNVDREKGKVAVSLKHLTPDPWRDVEARYPVGSRHVGEVINVMPYGAFVKLEPGVEGLVHVSEMSWVRRVSDPNEVVRVGQPVEVQVLAVDRDKKEMSLGMKQCTANPWDEVAAHYPPGTAVSGTVRHLVKYGAFVELEPGIDALLHVSDMSWVRNVSDPSEVVRKGQAITCVVLSVDPPRKRIAVGLKQLTEDPWEHDIPARYRPGRKVRGTVTKVTDFGAFVELESGLEGLLHVSALSETPVQSPGDVVTAGDGVDVKVLRVDSKNRTIALTMRYVDDPTVPPHPADTAWASLAPVPPPPEPDPAAEAAWADLCRRRPIDSPAAGEVREYTADGRWAVLDLEGGDEGWLSLRAPGVSIPATDPGRRLDLRVTQHGSRVKRLVVVPVSRPAPPTAAGPPSPPTGPAAGDELLASAERLAADAANPTEVVAAFRTWAEARPSADRYLRAATVAEQLGEYGHAEFLYYHAKKHDRGNQIVQAGIDRVLARKRAAAGSLPPVPPAQDDPYLFVSFAATDRDEVTPIVERLRASGCRLRAAGTDLFRGAFPDQVAGAIRQARALLLFFTRKAATSRWLQEECQLAFDEPIPLIPIFLEPAVPTGDFQLLLAGAQSIRRYEMSEDEFLRVLLAALPADVIGEPR